TPLGEALIAETEGKVCATKFAVKGRNVVAELKREWKYATLIEDQKGTAKLAKQVYRPNPAPVSVFMVGNEFNRKVWTLLLKIPAGTMVRYGDVAKAA